MMKAFGSLDLFLEKGGRENLSWYQLVNFDPLGRWCGKWIQKDSKRRKIIVTKGESARDYDRVGNSWFFIFQKLMSDRERSLRRLDLVILWNLWALSDSNR